MAKLCGGIRIDDGAAIGRRNHSVRSFQHDDGAAPPRSGLRFGQFVAGGVEYARELAVMRRHDACAPEWLPQVRQYRARRC